MDEYAGQYAVTDGSVIIPAALADNWEVILEVADSYNVTRKTVTVGSQQKVWSLIKQAGGIVGAAIGKIADIKDALEVAWVLRPHKGIGMAEYSVATLQELDDAMTAYHDSLGDNTVGHMSVFPTAEIGALGTSRWLVTVYKFYGGYGAAEAINYENPPKKMARNLYFGTWGDWTER